MPFARFENFEACTLEQRKLGHDEESANKICGEIKDRAEKGALLKAAPLGLEVLSKASEEDIIVGGYASWECVDDDGDLFTVEAQAKALQTFFAQPPEFQAITINHGRGLVHEMKLAQPMLKYVAKDGKEYFSHVNEKGTYLIGKIRNDQMKSTQYYRAKAKAGELNGYSVNVIPITKDPVNQHKILDMEYTAVTLTEKGVMRPRNPMTRNVEVLSKAQSEAQTPTLNGVQSKGADVAVINEDFQLVPLPDAKMNYPVNFDNARDEIEAILRKYGFTNATSR